MEWCAENWCLAALPRETVGSVCIQGTHQLFQDLPQVWNPHLPKDQFAEAERPEETCRWDEPNVHQHFQTEWNGSKYSADQRSEEKEEELLILIGTSNSLKWETKLVHWGLVTLIALNHQATFGGDQGSNTEKLLESLAKISSTTSVLE